jgi:crotonobetainyl-CoA:carnitine CoA-transferase CaiB-like acyl-CoA transferase
MTRLPLEGVRILDLSSVVLGPYASQILGDYGADVIKIEAPEGDSTRRTGPGREPGMAAIFLGVNRNKRSVVLDLKRPEAREALLALVDTADVFMHSIRPQKLPALGLDPETLMARNPRLVYAGLHGFAQDGPYGGKPAYDDIIQGLSGLAALMERQSGEPRYLPTIAADKTCGLVAAHAILAALFARAHRSRPSSRCRCSSRSSASCWWSTTTAATSSRRSRRRAIRACSRPGAARTRRWTATSA